MMSPTKRAAPFSPAVLSQFVNGPPINHITDYIRHAKYVDLIAGVYIFEGKPLPNSPMYFEIDAIKITAFNVRNQIHMQPDVKAAWKAQMFQSQTMPFKRSRITHIVLPPASGGEEQAAGQ